MVTTTNAKAEFRITSWDEQAYGEFAGSEKLTRTTVAQTYTGDLEGEGKADSLMYYPPAAAPVPYVGLERFTCTLAGRAGTFVAQSHGAYADGVAEVNWSVVPGSGTGGLAGLRGDGGYRAAHGEEAIALTFDYWFEA
jgi:hypothetical protein